MMLQSALTYQTNGRELIDMTAAIRDLVAKAKVTTGLCHLFLHHTSASIILCENADPQVQRDLEAFFARLIPDGDPAHQHIAEGPDDMPAHIRTILTQNSLIIPITNTQLALGQWQGIYLWEHRLAPHARHVTVTIYD